MPVSVPTIDEFNAALARITALEQAQKPPNPGGPSADGAKVTNTTDVLTTNDATKWRLLATQGSGNIVQFAPSGSTTYLAAGSTSQVAGIEKWTDGIYQWSTVNGSRFGKPGWWRGSMATATTFGTWTDVAGDPSAPPPVTATGFTVDANGFKDSTGATWSFRGMNAGVQDALDDRHCKDNFPHMNMLRLNCNSGGDSTANIDLAVQKFIGFGMVVLIEDHSGNTRNLGWYSQMAGIYKTNGMVMLGTANEPGGNVQQDQIDIVTAIRAAGFNNPIGLQCGGGYQFGHLQGVLNSVGRTQLFCTPHIYYSGSDPNGSQNYINTDINNCKQLGLWCIFTEFGDGMDGWHRDQYGIQLCRQVITAQQNNQCGALFWAMDNNNHADGCCSVYAVRDGSRLTSPVMGVDPVDPWLSA